MAAGEIGGRRTGQESGGVPSEGARGFSDLLWRKSSGRSGHIITIDVIEAARRLGVGSALLAAAEERLREKGAVAVELETAVNNEAAIRFYKKKGYFVEGTLHGYYSNGLDALVMEKRLGE